MGNLRQYIRRIILEDYELTQADIKKYRAEFPDASEEEIRQYADWKGVGIQGKKKIARDKQAMRDWHELMKQNPQFVKQFMKGKVQILHSLTYDGTYSDKADMYDRGSDTPFTDWIKRFGYYSKDQISCVAANAPIGQDPDLWSWDMGNGIAVYGEGYGFLLKGYPAFAAEYDVMSQTLSAIPDTLKDFHRNSGQVKRADSIMDAIDPKNWKGVDELILDNWEIIGVYIADYFFEIEEGDAIIADAKNLGLPVYSMSTSRKYILTKV